MHRRVRNASRHYADIAASVRAPGISSGLRRCGREDDRAPERRFAGGVALNSLASGRLQRELGIDLYVQPAPGDAGGALGAALLHHHRSGGSRSAPLRTAYLGQAFDDQAIVTALTETGLKDAARDRCRARRTLPVVCAAAGVIGWFQGR
jgi:carbamoyltransferase